MLTDSLPVLLTPLWSGFTPLSHHPSICLSGSNPPFLSRTAVSLFDAISISGPLSRVTNRDEKKRNEGYKKGMNHRIGEG